MLIQILIDNYNSWIIPYAKKLIAKIERNHKFDVILVHRHKDVIKGEILILLSCLRKFKNLDLNKSNIIVHESDLPKGKGWSPVTWQIIEGKTKIPVTLFEAENEIDSGKIYLKEYFNLNGGELLNEIRDKQGRITIKLILEYLNSYPKNKSYCQTGEESYYAKRTKESSRLDVDKNIKDQFNILRVCDNDNYPAFFIMNNKKYVLKIYEEN